MSLRMVPSGLLASNSTVPWNPTAFTISSERARIVSSLPVRGFGRQGCIFHRALLCLLPLLYSWSHPGRRSADGNGACLPGELCARGNLHCYGGLCRVHHNLSLAGTRSGNYRLVLLLL